MDNFEAYAEQMQKMYADAFAAAEKMKEGAMADRHAAAEELDKAKDIRKAAEQNGEKMALEYFAGKRKILIEQTREETLSRGSGNAISRKSNSHFRSGGGETPLPELSQ